MTLDEQISRLGAQTVLCVGDVMLDEFIYGEVSRISPEAATPVLAVRRSETQIGGAGNVARNIASLGAGCLFVGVVGEDEEGRKLKAEFLNTPRIEAHLVLDAARPTTRKVRFVSEHHSTHLLRADWEAAAPVSADVEAALLERCRTLVPRADAVLLSDYAKGVLTERVVRALVDSGRQAGKPVIVDPKGQDYAIYRGATLITPNRKELAEASRFPADNDRQIEAAAAEVARLAESNAVLVTRSEEGMSLYRREGEALHIPAHPVRVRDVTGAGDTVAATVAAFLAAGAEFEAAMRAANAAAAVVVGKRGTATASAAELRAKLSPQAARTSEEKIVVDRAALAEHLGAWRRTGLRVGFTNGCFDLIHPGHIKLIAAARAACDRLIVGLNSDASVARLKGAGRPLQDQQARAEVLAALEAVDLVVIFEEDTPLELIRWVRPTLLVKGADYAPHEVVGREFVEANGGEILLVELAAGHSTSRLVEGSKQRVAT